MSADHDHDLSGACCHCADCTGPGEDASLAWDRTYYVPDPPKIPLPPGSTATTAPPEEPGYKGPRFHTLLRGDDWNDPQLGIPALVPYAFATRAMTNYVTSESPGREGFESTSGEPLDAVQRASIRQALDLWEQVSGLTFVEVPDTALWDFSGVRFLMEGLDSPGLLGISIPHDEPYGFNVAFNRVTYADDPLQRGTDAFYTAMHEIGHAIGLKHPFMGDLVLRQSEDKGSNTVMSYKTAGNYTHLGPYDIAAAQYIYGAPEAKAGAAIRWSQGPGGSLITSGNHEGNSITGLGSRDIVLAGSGDDVVRMNGGDDDVAPGAGNDAVFGGAGVDALFTGALRRQAAVTVGRDEGTVALPDGTDSFHQVEILRFVDGSLHFHAHGAAGQAYRLYGAALGRAPDPTGLGQWAEALHVGATNLLNAAGSFAGSAEFAARFGAPDDAGFVSLLYQNVLGRAADAAGLSFWVNTMHAPGGGGRAGVLLGFSESAEYQKKTAPVFAQGLWVADTEAVDVLRGYSTVLDRRPDAGGLVNWVAAREAGLSQPELIQQLVASPEFQARFGGLSNRDFVEQLYRTALDREADPGGSAYWTQILDAGVDGRAGVALGFSNSVEMSIKLTPFVADGILFM